MGLQSPPRHFTICLSASAEVVYTTYTCDCLKLSVVPRETRWGMTCIKSNQPEAEAQQLPPSNLTCRRAPRETDTLYQEKRMHEAKEWMRPRARRLIAAARSVRKDTQRRRAEGRAGGLTASAGDTLLLVGLPSTTIFLKMGASGRSVHCSLSAMPERFARRASEARQHESQERERNSSKVEEQRPQDDAVDALRSNLFLDVFGTPSVTKEKRSTRQFDLGCSLRMSLAGRHEDVRLQHLENIPADHAPAYLH